MNKHGQYPITLTKHEVQVFNTYIENENIRASAMSIFSYLLKENKKQNTLYNKTKHKFFKKDKYKLKISCRKFLAKYNNRGIKDKKISLTTLKNRIHLLADIGLISIEKKAKTFVYSFNRYFHLTNNVTDNLTNQEVAVTVDTTNLNTSEEKDKGFNSKKHHIDIDIRNNSSTDKYHKDYFVADKLEKCNSWSDITELLFEVFKKFKIKSKKLQGEVINRLEKNLTNITKKFAGNYIEKTALYVIYKEKQRRVAYANAIKSNYHFKHKDNWNYDGQRDPNYYASFENALLGWS